MHVNLAALSARREFLHLQNSTAHQPTFTLHASTSATKSVQASRFHGLSSRVFLNRHCRFACDPEVASAICTDGHSDRIASSSSAQTSAGAASRGIQAENDVLYPPDENNSIRDSWKLLMRWSRNHTRERLNTTTALDRTNKVRI